jgi:hypothetical protein
MFAYWWSKLAVSGSANTEQRGDEIIRIDRRVSIGHIGAV